MIARNKLTQVLADWCPAYPGLFYVIRTAGGPARFVDFVTAAPK